MTLYLVVPMYPIQRCKTFLDIICGSVSLLVYSFVCCMFKISHTSDNIQCLCFSVWHFINHNTLKVCSCCKWQNFTLLLFSLSVLPDSLRLHGLQLVRPPCLSLSPGSCTNSCPLSWWCHPTNSSSVAPFSSCPQSFPASGSFPMGRHFESGGQRFV